MDIPWTERFVDIVSGHEAPTSRSVRTKMTWNDSGLFLFAHLAEPAVAATVTRSGPAILDDNTFELLIDPDNDGLNYYELQVNALGTCWELALPKPYAAGGVADLSARVAGLRHAVRVHGVLNDPRHLDHGWDVSLALPWAGLAPFQNSGACPPRPGDVWRINLARLQWCNGGKEFWVWSPQGEVNLHAPARWGDLEFVVAN